VSQTISRDEARHAGLAKYFTGRACCNGHVAERYTCNYRCIECDRHWHKDPKWIAYQKRWSKENGEQRRTNARLNYNRERKAAWRKANPERYATLQREWYQRNKANLQEIRRTWRATNPDKAKIYYRNYRAKKRQSAGTHSAEDIAAIYTMQRGRCVDCGALLQSRKWEVDHIQPISQGGSNNKANLQILCRPCNRYKADKDPFRHARLLGRLL